MDLAPGTCATVPVVDVSGLELPGLEALTIDWYPPCVQIGLYPDHGIDERALAQAVEQGQAAMLAAHAEKMPALTLMTTTLDDPANYGRIVRDNKGRLLEIVEEKDADEAQKAIHEVNAGIYCADTSFLFNALRKVGTDNKQGEVYLTDIVKIGIAMGLQVETFSGAGGAELLGINSRSELAAANRHLQQRKNNELMAGGVSLVDPETIFIQQEVKIGADTVIHANVQVSGNSIIGSGCTIGPDVVLHRCTVGDNVTIGPFSNLAGCTVRDNEVIAPHSSLVHG